MQNILNRFNVSLLLFISWVDTQAAYNIGTTSQPWSQKIALWFQELVNLMEGPIGKALVFLSLLFVIAAWMWDPRNGAMGWAIRVVVGAILIINLAAFISSL